jgi:S-adenosylmethionine decarboxylase
MSCAFPVLHPNPGWTPTLANGTLANGTIANSATNANSTTGARETTGLKSDPFNSNVPITDTVGKHCILELYDCDCAKLDDESLLRSAISNAALRAGATLLQLISHRFEPHGVTGLALLAESHISIHTWPESGYAAVDVFTCGDHTMPERACRVLAEELGSRRHKLSSFRRETPGQIAGAAREPAAAEPSWPG